MVSVIGARFAFATGRLPCFWFRRDPWEVAVAPPVSPYIGPDSSLPVLLCAVGAQVGVSSFHMRRPVRIIGDYFCQFHCILRVLDV